MLTDVLLACFLQGLRACVCKQMGKLVKICFLLHEINVHRFLLLMVVSL